MHGIIIFLSLTCVTFALPLPQNVSSPSISQQEAQLIFSLFQHVIQGDGNNFNGQFQQGVSGNINGNNNVGVIGSGNAWHGASGPASEPEPQPELGEPELGEPDLGEPELGEPGPGAPDHEPEAEPQPEPGADPGAPAEPASVPEAQPAAESEPAKTTRK